MTLANDLPQVAVHPADSASDLTAIVGAEAPVVLKRTFEHWPALEAGRHSAARMNAYLKSMDIGAAAPVMEAPASSNGWHFYAAGMQEFNFSKRAAGIAETLDRIEQLAGQPGAPFVAIQMLPLTTHLPEFVRQNPSALLPPR